MKRVVVDLIVKAQSCILKAVKRFRLLLLIALFAIAFFGAIHLPGSAQQPQSGQSSPATNSSPSDPFALYERGRFEAARQAWEQAANTAAQRGDRLTEIRNRINEAQALKALGAYPRAERTLKATLTLLDGVEPNQQIDQTVLFELRAKGLRSLGETYQAMGNLDQSRTALQQSLKIATELDDREMLSATYFSLGMTERSAVLREASRLLTLTATQASNEQGAQLKALRDLLQQNVPAAIESQESTNQSPKPSLFTVSSAFQNATQFTNNSTVQLRSQLSQTSLIIDLLPRLNQYINSLLSATSNEILEYNSDYFINNFLGDAALIKQLAPLQPVFRTVRGMNDRSEELPRLAIADLQAVTVQARELTDRAVQGMSQLSVQISQLPNTGDAAETRLHYAQTLLRLKQVADGSDRVDNRLREQLQTVFGMVQAYYDTPEYKTKLPSQATIDRVIKKANTDLQSPQRSLFLRNTTRLALQQTVKTSLTQATQVLIPAIERAQEVNNVRTEASANVLLSTVYALSADITQTSNYWSDVQTLSQRAIQLTQVEDAPDLMLRAQQQYARSLIKQGKTAPAQAACRVAATTLQANRGNLVTIDQDVQYSFLESVDPFYRECVTTLLPKSPELTNQENLKSAQNLIEALQLAELDNFFRESCIEGRKEIIDSIIRDQKSLKTAVIYPILLSKQEVGVILKLPNVEDLQYRLTQLDQPNQDVEALLAQLTNQLLEPTSTSTSIQPLGNQVYQLLIAPFREQLQGIDTLVFVPDAAFRNVPMAALYDDETNHYLIDDFAIALSPGLQLIKPKLEEKIALNAIGAGLIEIPSQYDLGEFPPAAIEQEFNVLKTVGILSQPLLLENAFTSAALAKQLERFPVNIVHLSTHAGFSSQKDQTYVLMANGKVNVDDFGAVLQKRIQKQEGTIDLLVLSACQTVRGDNRAALGLAGIAIKSGARSTLATFWTVDAKQTANLIDSFYQEYVDKTTKTPKQTKAKALQAAQLKLKQETDQPSIWASYVLVGNWL